MHEAGAKRCFIGMRVTVATRRTVAALQRELLSELGEAAALLKPTHPEDLHATLKFLGSTSHAQIEALEHLLEETAGRHPPMHAEVVGVDAFGAAHEPHAIFGRIGAGRAALEALMQELDEKSGVLGFTRDAAPRVPHVTLFRVKRRTHGALEAVLKARFVRPLGALAGEAVVLFESAPSGEPRYRALATATLRGRA